jgi:hypothetical protein
MALVDLEKYRRPSESLLDAYRRLQSECKHQERDSRGTCFRCGYCEKKATREKCSCVVETSRNPNRVDERADPLCRLCDGTGIIMAVRKLPARQLTEYKERH